MWDDSKYVLFKSSKKAIADELIKIWESWANQYPIVSLEDGMGENDWEGWKNLATNFGDKDRVGRRRFVLHQSQDSPGGHR